MKENVGAIVLIVFVSLVVFLYLPSDPTGAVVQTPKTHSYSGETIIVPCNKQGAADYARDVLQSALSCTQICDLGATATLPKNIHIQLKCTSAQQFAQFKTYCQNSFLQYCG